MIGNSIADSTDEGRPRQRLGGTKTAIDVVENSGPDNLRDLLKQRLAQSSVAHIAVAFVTQSGLDDLLQSLRQVAAHGKVSLLTGLYQSVTEPQALRTLLTVQEETRGNFSVSLSREPKFHRKVYLLYGKGRATAIVGSSNLTSDGLRSGGELNLVVSLPKYDTAIKRLQRAFEKDWKHRAVPLTDTRIKRYARCRRKPSTRQSYSRGQLREILGSEPVHEGALPEHEPIVFWRDWVEGIASRPTQQLISNTTTWDERGYLWFASRTRHPCKIQDRMFLFDFNDKRLDLVEVEDITHTLVKTPDGRNFVAYKPLRRYGRRFSKVLWTELRQEGIPKIDARRLSKIKHSKADRLMHMIRSTK